MQMRMQQRRKPPPAPAPVPAKQPTPRRTPGPVSFAAALLLSLLLVVTFLHVNDHAVARLPLARARPSGSPDLRLLQEQEAAHQKVEVVAAGNSSSGEGCDLYKGWWVYDAEGRQAPLYREPECEFLTEQVTCMRNGRRDESYQRWRWQPEGCDLPGFDARALLERLRNKRMMFVGDSLNRNQWESMVCLVQSAIPHGHKTLTKFVNNGSLNVFRAHEYNATVEFYWAPFLVQSNSDDPQVHSVRDRVIAWRSIAKHAANWKGVHYLVFNTYIWWLNTFDIKVLKNRGADPKGKGKEGWWSSSRYALVDRPIAYREVLKTWAKWVDRRIDPTKTTVFFMAMSPNHITPEAWGGSAGAVKCAMETQPIMNRTWGLDIGTDWRLHGVARGVLRSMRRVPVRFVDITALSELRKDAHTSVHTLRQGKLLTPEQQSDPRTYADCIHWCLPGLPDTWNHFLYAHIVAHAA
ncbi:protein trichome birefringence-like 28 isoform X2 [Oryza brachyantha]|uniref:protein trichome birefringence-like 28 isoform X2 n=1 Tax=Oryza brachyantha TaxID=4533 RepID=UPI001ADA8BE6|nr:protein trichome birefringence-like 28 isoform X2 [Oryza brachyantha]